MHLCLTYSPPDYAEVTAAGATAAAAPHEDDGKREEGAGTDAPPPEYSTLFVEGCSGGREEESDSRQ